MADQPINVVILAYEGDQTLDVVGPLDAFASAESTSPGSYRTKVVSLDGKRFLSETGLRIEPDCALGDAGPIDTLVLPGGASLRRSGTAEPIAEALRRIAPKLRRLVSVCTGLYGLALSGLADGRRVTTHWKFADDIQVRYPALRVEADAIFIKDGSLYTSAGITASIDVALALIEEDYGPQLSLAAARDLVVYVKRSGGQRQYSEPLRLQMRSSDRFQDLTNWMAESLDQDLSVDALASRVGLSPRQFGRRFLEAFGVTPAAQVEALRLDAARDLIIGSGAGIEQIARAVGFETADVFRRRFEREFGLSPTDYRHRFSAPMGENDAAV